MVSDFEITGRENGFTIGATMLHYDGRRTGGDGYDVLRRDLEKAVGAPVELVTTLVDAPMLPVSPTNRELDLLTATRRALADAGATVADSWVEPQMEQTVVRAVVYLPPDRALDDATIDAINAALTERFRRSVQLSLTVLPAQVLVRPPRRCRPLRREQVRLLEET
ncbi:MAG: hypothetical protein R2838_14450 [Caldilineaceae bacterium]